MDLSWSELMVVAVVALVVIGPKDLPGMFRELGRFTAKIRAMGRDFSRAMEQAAKETGVKDVADDLKKMTSPKAMGLDAVRSAADKFEKWDPLKPALKPAVAHAAKASPLVPPPMPGTPAVASVATGPATSVATAAGPATAALSAKVAAKTADAAQVAEGLRAAKDTLKSSLNAAGKPATDGAETGGAKAAAKAKPKGAAVAPSVAAASAGAAEPVPVRGGRVRKKADPKTGDAA